MISSRAWLSRIPAEDLAGCSVVWTEPAIEWCTPGPDWVREQLGDRRFLTDWLSLNS